MLRYRYGTLDGFTFWELDRFVIYVSYFFPAGYGSILYCVLCHQVETFCELKNHGTLTGIIIRVTCASCILVVISTFNIVIGMKPGMS